MKIEKKKIKIKQAEEIENQRLELRRQATSRQLQESQRDTCCRRSCRSWSRCIKECLDEVLIPQKFIISFKNTRKEAWDIFVLALAF